MTPFFLELSPTFAIIAFSIFSEMGFKDVVTAILTRSSNCTIIMTRVKFNIFRCIFGSHGLLAVYRFEDILRVQKYMVGCGCCVGTINIMSKFQNKYLIFYT